MASVIEMSNVVKDFRLGLSNAQKVRALDGVFLTVSEGEIFALLGLNGAGKTTLTRILLDLVRPTSGTVLLFGTPVSTRLWKNHVGYLPELFRAPASFTADGVLRYLGALSGLKGKRLENRIEQVLSNVDLLAARFQKVETFSKGMMLRLGIAQALLNEPKLLVLDEPTEGLDPFGKLTMRTLLAELPKKGVTVLINSHLLSEIELIAHRVVILHKGRIVTQGALNDLLPKNSRFEIEVPSKPHLPGAWEFREKSSSWICEVEGTEQLQEVLGSLKHIDIPVTSISPIKTTLEDLFLTHIREA